MRHYFGAQTIPINRNRVVCLHCGKVVSIKELPNLSGKRLKCSTTMRMVHLPDSGVGQYSTATKKIVVRSLGHAEYRMIGR